jgi:hypothetical protein
VEDNGLPQFQELPVVPHLVEDLVVAAEALGLLQYRRNTPFLHVTLPLTKNVSTNHSDFFF